APRACCALHSFPTRRSSDLGQFGVFLQRLVRRAGRLWLGLAAIGGVSRARENGNLFIRGKVDQRPLGRTKAIDAGDIRVAQEHEDRKSTRLNSSHVAISYAV